MTTDKPDAGNYDDRRMTRMIRLDELRRKLMYIKLETLGLKYLQPLRDEVQAQLDAIYAEAKAEKEAAGTSNDR